ncbi:MAG TPA: RidA family protein [Pyrinomonadaceae bacterium]
MAHDFTQIIRVKTRHLFISEWNKMNAIYRTYFPNNRPARSSLGVNGLVLNARVEIECIAAIR